MQKRKNYLDLFMWSGIFTNSVLAVMTFWFIITEGKITYIEPIKLIAWTEFSLAIFIFFYVIYNMAEVMTIMIFQKSKDFDDQIDSGNRTDLEIPT